MSQKKIKGVQLNFTIKEIRQLEVIVSNVIFIKGGFKKVSKFERDFWHTLKDICNDVDDITEINSLKKKLH
jgi:predicted DNA-binding ribbon-helix-helix protein